MVGCDCIFQGESDYGFQDARFQNRVSSHPICIGKSPGNERSSGLDDASMYQDLRGVMASLNHPTISLLKVG